MLQKCFQEELEDLCKSKYLSLVLMDTLNMDSRKENRMSIVGERTK